MTWVQHSHPDLNLLICKKGILDQRAPPRSHPWVTLTMEGLVCSLALYQDAMSSLWLSVEPLAQQSNNKSPSIMELREPKFGGASAEPDRCLENHVEGPCKEAK